MKVLIVDDDSGMRRSLRGILEMDGIEVGEAENGLAAGRRLEDEVYETVVADLRMPGMNGLELLAFIKEKYPLLPVIMISAHGEVEDAVAAMKAGAFDYLVKPFDAEELLIRIQKAARQQALAEENQRLRAEQRRELLGTESPAMAALLRVVAKAAPSSSTVLITGESGTGKEVLARELHRRSPRSPAPFVPVNIGAVPENLLESELFGYEKGAFTGAAGRKRGQFESAGAGTLFLDEIGDMPLHLQVKILRVLQDRTFQRLGGTEPIPLRARLAAATNRDLEAMVKAGTFREDLYYRLNVIRLHVPPLRERREDIPGLCGELLAGLSQQMGRPVPAIAPEALRVLQSYAFPGNIRELENLLERALILSEQQTLAADDFSIPVSQPVEEDSRPESGGAAGVISPPVEAYLAGKSLAAIERLAIQAALQRWEGRKSRAAEELGIDRKTLFNKEKEFGL